MTDRADFKAISWRRYEHVLGIGHHNWEANRQFRHHGVGAPAEAGRLRGR